MKVAAIGFNDYDEFDKVMQEFIAENDCLIFSIVCGGLDIGNPTNSIPRQWAINNGAPLCLVYDKDINKLMGKIEKEADYLTIRITKDTPQVCKNLIMKMKNQGKHGKVIKGGE